MKNALFLKSYGFQKKWKQEETDKNSYAVLIALNLFTLSEESIYAEKRETALATPVGCITSNMWVS
jgi:hypothetical protein